MIRSTVLYRMISQDVNIGITPLSLVPSLASIKPLTAGNIKRSL